jgi:hypothetical protein
MSYSILPAQPGALVNIAGPGVLPPAGVPAPMLEPAHVLDPPLPPVLAVSTVAPTGAADNSTSWQLASLPLVPELSLVIPSCLFR